MGRFNDTVSKNGDRSAGEGDRAAFRTVFQRKGTASEAYIVGLCRGRDSTRVVLGYERSVCFIRLIRI